MWHAATDLLVTDLGDELVLMHPAHSQMFSLNASGRLIWQALPASAEALAEQLQAAYGLDPAQAQQDVQVVLQELEVRQLASRT